MLPSQTTALHKWIELANERVGGYLRALGRMPPAAGNSPAAQAPGRGVCRHFALTDLPPRWKAPRGPCTSSDLGTSDEEAGTGDRKAGAKGAGKQMNRCGQNLMGDNTQALFLVTGSEPRWG